MPDRNKPVRHDATGRIIREWDSERKQCADLEVDYTNAGAQVYIAEQNLRRAEGERDGLMRKRERVENELAVLQQEIEKEKQQGRRAINRGAEIFGPIGAIIGMPTGPGGMMAIGAEGMVLGGRIGKYLEEIGDSINSNTKTDITLNLQKQNLLRKKQEIEKNLLSVLNSIKNSLSPKYENKKKEETLIRERLLNCRRKN